ncbi:MAG: hypothetical protein U1E05_05480 [Patescibacteria group bacterium]|nr:hypothetical protein [Patescibacteria group bacterium]
MQRSSKRFSGRAWCPIAMLSVLAAGCGGGSDLPMSPVRGTVTYQGKPLARGEVVFTPVEGTTGPQAVGHIQSDSSFQLRTANRPGAVVGKHRVTVHCKEEGTEEQRRDMNFIPKSLIPAEYSNVQASSIHVEVRPGGNDVPIELK